MNLDQAYKTRLETLIELSKEPGWKAYAWNRAKQLDAESSGLFKGIAKDLEACMLRLKDEQAKAGD